MTKYAAYLYYKSEKSVRVSRLFDTKVEAEQFIVEWKSAADKFKNDDLRVQEEQQ